MILAKYSLYPTSFLYISSTNSLCSNGLQSSTSPRVIMKFHKSTFSLHIRCRLNPKNHSIDFLLLIASECLMNKNLLSTEYMQRVLSTKLLCGNTFENRGCICLLIFSDGNVWDNGNLKKKMMIVMFSAFTAYNHGNICIFWELWGIFCYLGI